MQKVTCPACNQETFEAKYCMHCHARLHADPDTPGDDTHAAFLLMSARRVRAEHHALTLVDIGVTDQLPDGSLPNIKKLAVPAGVYTVMVSRVHGARVLAPGEYDASRLGLGGGLGASLAAGNEVRPLYLCTVSQQPILATFALPDYEALSPEQGSTPAEEDPQAVIRALSFRTADNMLGAASLQMLLRCVNPCRVLEMLFQAKLAEMQQRAALLGAKQASANLAQKKSKQPISVLSPAESQYLSTCQTLGLVDGAAPENAGVFGHLFKYPWELVRWVLWGSRPKSGGLATLSGKITLADLYSQFRTGLCAAIAEAIRKENVEVLYRSAEGRDRAAADIQRIASRAFDLCGMKVDRVAGLRFISPEYEGLLARRGQITLDRANLSDRNQEAKIDRLRREIEAGAAQHASTTEKEIERHIASEQAALARHKVQENRRTERDLGELQSERQQRELAKDSAAHEHRLDKEKSAAEQNLQLELQAERQQQALQDERARMEMERQDERERMEFQRQDERERLELQRQDERLDMAFRWQGRLLELQNKEREAAMERRTKMLGVYAQLPKESILTIALAENPQLASAYAEAMKAQGQQNTSEMQERFRSELARAYESNSQQFAAILQEAVRQWGQYQSAKQIGQQPPQQVINVALPKPEDGPSPGPEANSQEPSP